MPQHYVLRVNPWRPARSKRRRNPTRTRRALRAEKPIFDGPMIVITAITAGIALLLLARPSGATPMPLPQPGGGGPSPGPNPVPPGQSLDDRLRSSDTARQIWLFQAELFMYGYAREQPDGIDGPYTQSLIAQVNNDTGFGSSGTSWVPDMVRRGRLALQQQQMHETGSSTLGESSFSITNQPSADVMALLEQTSQSVDPDTTFH